MDTFSISAAQQRSLLMLVRYTIAERLGLSTEEYVFVDDAFFDTPCGAFVTLHKDGQLRGCIGYIEPCASLRDTIRDMAVAAAFSDPRFPKLEASEFEGMDVEISILSPIFPIKAESVEVGIHGLIVSLGGRRGLLLPQVPVEQGWDRVYFLQHTCLKAGLPTDAWQHGAKLEAFTACVFGENQ
jgi:uncharacterized protein